MEILLSDDDEVHTYGPGDLICGTVRLSCGRGSLRFVSLSVTLKGVAKSGWREATMFGGNSGKMLAKEMVYIDEKKFLLGGRGSGARQRIPEGGHHDFEFTFRLPQGGERTMPSSFEQGQFGSIRYGLANISYLKQI